MSRRAIELSEQQVHAIEALVAGGRFASAEEVINEGLRLVASGRPLAGNQEEALRAAIREGLDDLEHGRFVEFDSVEAMEADLDKMFGDVVVRSAAE